MKINLGVYEVKHELKSEKEDERRKEQLDKLQFYFEQMIRENEAFRIENQRLRELYAEGRL